MTWREAVALFVFVGATALHRAAFNGHQEVVKALIDAQADVGAQDTSGKAGFVYQMLAFRFVLFGWCLCESWRGSSNGFSRVWVSFCGTSPCHVK